MCQIKSELLQIIGSIAFLVITILVVVLVKTLTFGVDSSLTDVVAQDVHLDEAGAVERFAKSLTYQTISHTYADTRANPEFTAFHNYLRGSFSRVFSQLHVEVINEYSLLIRWPGGQSTTDKPILLLSHMDVVPVIPGTEGLWSHPPFAGKVSDNIVWGRGAVDDKSGVLGILEAAETLLAEGFTPQRDIYFAFGHDEEVGGQQGAFKIASLLQERGVRLEFVLDEGGAITEGLIPGVEVPVALVGPGEKGYLSLKLVARDAGGHSSQPPEITAAGRIARAVSRVQESPFPINLDYTAEFIASLGDSSIYGQRLVFANQWLFSPVIESFLPENPALLAGMRTTTAPTILKGSVKDNVLPIHAEAVINFRIIPGESIASVTERVVALIDDEQVDVEAYGFVSEPSKISSTDSFGFRQLERAIAEGVGDPELIIAPRLVIGATDARHFSEITRDSFRFIGIRLGPEELKGFHGSNEHVSVSSYLEAVKIYYLLMKNSAS